MYKQAQASLNSGINLRAAVKLPQGEDLNDWIAVHGKIFMYFRHQYNAILPTNLITCNLLNISPIEINLLP